MGRSPADRDHTAAVEIEIGRDMPDLPRFALQMRVHKNARIREVAYDGRALKEGDEDAGYVTWDDNASWIIRVNVNTPPTKGTHTAAARYEIEW